MPRSGLASAAARASRGGALAAVVLGATACATAHAPRGDGVPPAAQRGSPTAGGGARAGSAVPTEVTGSSGAVVTAADFDRMRDAASALVVIERLRPFFLRPRMSFGAVRGRAPTISVYVNDVYAGGVDALRAIPPHTVASARYVQPTEAVTKLGPTRAADGVIMVRLRRGAAH